MKRILPSIPSAVHDLNSRNIPEQHKIIPLHLHKYLRGLDIRNTIRSSPLSKFVDDKETASRTRSYRHSDLLHINHKSTSDLISKKNLRGTFETDSFVVMRVRILSVSPMVADSAGSKLS